MILHISIIYNLRESQLTALYKVNAQTVDRVCLGAIFRMHTMDLHGERERETEREKIYIYIYIFIER